MDENEDEITSVKSKEDPMRVYHILIQGLWAPAVIGTVVLEGVLVAPALYLLARSPCVSSATSSLCGMLIALPFLPLLMYGGWLNKMGWKKGMFIQWMAMGISRYRIFGMVAGMLAVLTLAIYALLLGGGYLITTPSTDCCLLHQGIGWVALSHAVWTWGFILLILSLFPGASYGKLLVSFLFLRAGVIFGILGVAWMMAGSPPMQEYFYQARRWLPEVSMSLLWEGTNPISVNLVVGIHLAGGILLGILAGWRWKFIHR